MIFSLSYSFLYVRLLYWYLHLYLHVANFLVYLFFIVFLQIISKVDSFGLKVIVFLFIFIYGLLCYYVFFVLTLLFHSVDNQFPMFFVTFIDLLFGTFLIILFDIFLKFSRIFLNMNWSLCLSRNLCLKCFDSLNYT